MRSAAIKFALSATRSIAPSALRIFQHEWPGVECGNSIHDADATGRDEPYHQAEEIVAKTGIRIILANKDPVMQDVTNTESTHDGNGSMKCDGLKGCMLATAEPFALPLREEYVELANAIRYTHLAIGRSFTYQLQEGRRVRLPFPVPPMNRGIILLN